MGAVYLAHDTQLDRKVALKIPRFSARKKDEIVARFFREARSAATIRHPNVCPVHDVGEIDGIYYLTMAYIQGRTLSEFIRPEKPLPERQVAAVVSKLALALQEAHDCGVVHRDLKPSNIMIDRRNEPVIMDFGLARRTNTEESRATQQGTILGTPAYMSPEQVLGDPEKIGPQTDVYSLGVILYELLTAHLPYQGPPTAVVGQILATDPPPPQQHRTDLDPRLIEICAKAMAKGQEDRYQSMKDLAVALTEYLKHAQKTPAKQPPKKAADHDSMEQAFANIAASGIRTARRPSPKPLAQRLQQLAPLARRHRNLLISVAAGMLFFLGLWGIIVSLETPDGTLIVEIDDADAKVQVLSDEGKILLENKGKDGQVVFSLDPGKRRVRVEKDGQELFAQDVTIVSGKEKSIRAWWQAPQSDPVWDGRIRDATTGALRPARIVLDQSFARTWGKDTYPDLQVNWTYWSEGPLTDAILKDADMLVVSDRPSGMSLADAEVDTIVRFAQSGGGVLMGSLCWVAISYQKYTVSNSPPNQVAKHFGMVMNGGYADKPARFANHPMTRGLAEMEECEKFSVLSPIDLTSDEAKPLIWDSDDQVIYAYRDDEHGRVCFGPTDPFRTNYLQKSPQRNRLMRQIFQWLCSGKRRPMQMSETAPTLPKLIATRYATAVDPAGIQFDEDGYLYVGHNRNRRVKIRRVPPGGGEAEEWGDSDFTDPDSIDVCGPYVYVADSKAVWRVLRETAASECFAEFPGKHNVTTLAVDTAGAYGAAGNVYFAGQRGSIMRLATDGTETSLADSPYLKAPRDLQFAQGRLYCVGSHLWEGIVVIDRDGKVSKLDDAGFTWGSPKALAYHAAEDAFYVGDATLGQILRIPRTGGMPTVVPCDFDAEPVIFAGLTFDTKGNLYVSDEANNVIWRLTPPADQPPLAIAPFDAAQAKQHQKAWADYLDLPVEREVELPGGQKLTMVLIPPGEFMMGSLAEEQPSLVEATGATNNDFLIEQISTEVPRHRVRISQPFWLSRHEITRNLFRQFVNDAAYKTEPERDGHGGLGIVGDDWIEAPRFIWNTDPGFPQTEDHPVVNVTWNDAAAFCEWLSEKENEEWGLPTEAQWEYACCAGTTTLYSSGDSPTSLGDYAWLRANSDSKTHPVGQKSPNAWGLHDMHGNVWEWCADWAGGYDNRAAVDPHGPRIGSARIDRGGCWNSPASLCRSAYRDRNSQSCRHHCVGFRVACKIPKKPSQNANLPPRTPPSNLAVPANWQTWSHSLTTPDTLDSFYCASGQYGPYNTWLLAEIVENEGIKIRGGHTQTALWAPVSVGSSYQVSIEAKQADKARATRVHLLLAGPGYGNSTETSYCFVIRQEDVVLMREGVECCTAPLPSPTTIGQWFQLDAKVDQGNIQLLIDDVPVLQHTDPTPLTGPLHAWIGFVGRGETWYRNLQISAPSLNKDEEKELLPAPSGKPLPNGPAVYELPMDQQAIEKDWWLSRPKAVNVKNGSLDLRGFNSLSQLILKRPLHGNVAMEAEIEYPSPETLNFQMAFWAADKLPEEQDDRTGGWFAWAPSNHSNLSIQWHDKDVGCGWAWIPKSMPLAKTSYYAPIRQRRYLVRLEAVGNRARLFLDGRLILDAQRPTDAKGSDLPLYPAIGQMYAPVFVHALRIYQLDEKAGETLPTLIDPDRRAAEWVLGLGGSVDVVDSSGTLQIVRDATELGDKPFRLIVADLNGNAKSASELENLSGIETLQRLFASNTPIKDSDLVHLDDCRELHLARLLGTKVTDTGLVRFIDQHPKLVELSLDGTAVTDAILAHIGQKPRFQIISLGGTKITDKGLEHLESLPDLRSIRISNTPVTSTGLKSLHKHLKLENLELSGLPLKDDDIKAFPKLEALWAIQLEGTKVSDSGVVALAQQPNLRHIYLARTSVTDTALEHLARMPKLELLGVQDNAVTDAGLKKLETVDSLNTLYLDGTRVTQNGVASLQKALPKCRIVVGAPETTGGSAEHHAAEWVLGAGGIVSLKSKAGTVDIDDTNKLPEQPFTVRQIDLTGNKKICNEDLQNLQGLRELRRLALTDTQVSDEGLVHLQGLVSLWAVHLHGTRITDRGLESLKGLSNLQGLGLTRTAVTGSFLQHFQGHPALTVLELDSSQVNDQGLQWLKGLPNLDRLQIAHTRITDAGMQHLKHLSKLRSLHASDIPITDAGLESLQTLQELENLELCVTQVNDAGMKSIGMLHNITRLLLKDTLVGDEGLRHLQSLPRLDYLSLVRTQVTDEGLAHLATISSLRRLELQGTMVTAAGVAALQNSLSHCQIVSNASDASKESTPPKTDNDS